MDKIILTDCDGVLVNWNDAFDQYMHGQGYPRVPDTDACYNIPDRHGVDHDTAMDAIRYFNNSEHIKNLQPFADATKYVSMLADHGFKFVVLSSLSDTSHAHAARTENLNSIFGDIFLEINCISIGADKAPVLQGWKDSNYYWIEDHVGHAVTGFNLGLKSVLINHPYNNHYKDNNFPIVSNNTPWEEIYSIICKDYNL